MMLRDFVFHDMMFLSSKHNLCLSSRFTAYKNMIGYCKRSELFVYEASANLKGTGGSAGPSRAVYSGGKI